MRLTDIKRLDILRLHSEELSNGAIARELKVSKTTVANTLQRYRETNNIDDRSRSGRKKKFNNRLKRRICRKVLRQQLHNLKEVKEWVLERHNLSISVGSISSILKQNGIVYQRKKKNDDDDCSGDDTDDENGSSPGHWVQTPPSDDEDNDDDDEDVINNNIKSKNNLLN